MVRRGRKLAHRTIVLAALTVAALLIRPGSASAHAAFVSAQPEPGAELSSAPGVVELAFSEPLIERLSSATVTDPDGRTFRGGPTGEREIRVPVSSNAPGVYDVAWVTVSPVDGHTLRGSFRFGVGVSPGPGSEGSTTDEPQRVDLLLAIGRAIEYAALLLAVGMLLLNRLARRRPGLVWVRPGVLPALVVAFVGGTAVILGEAFLAGGAGSLSALDSYFLSGLPGLARLARVAAEALAILLALRGRSLVVPVGVALIALAAAGHAAAVSPRWWGITVDAVHLVAAGLWAGGILGLATLRPPGGWRHGEGRALLDRFTPVALAAFVATIGFGALRGTQELGAFDDLFDTSYGRVVLLKIMGVLVMVPLSTLLWLRISRSARGEAAVAVLVIAAAALLAAYPLPPARLGEAEAGEAPARGASALPRSGDVTLGGSAGEVLVGLTVRPGTPGPNEVLVYVLPLEGEEAAEGLPVRISLSGRTQEMEVCGPTCRRSETELRGGEQVRVHVGGPAGGTSTFRLPSLPPPDGGKLFGKMQDRMHQLRTYRIDEVLSSGRATVRATYAFEAPDRMRIAVEEGAQRIVIGEREWRREGPGDPWQEESAFPPMVPRFIWDSGEGPTAPTIVGRDRLDGVDTTVLSFVGGPGGTAIWFRLWVDPGGLVRRAEMRAIGHFMDHRYFAFDAPFQIEPPDREGGA
jgi:copper transport protein